jgi:hypothetical protein
LLAAIYQIQPAEIIGRHPDKVTLCPWKMKDRLDMDRRDWGNSRRLEKLVTIDIPGQHQDQRPAKRRLY